MILMNLSLVSDSCKIQSIIAAFTSENTVGKSTILNINHAPEMTGYACFFITLPP
jgi:predicted ATPase